MVTICNAPFATTGFKFAPISVHALNSLAFAILERGICGHQQRCDSESIAILPVCVECKPSSTTFLLPLIWQYAHRSIGIRSSCSFLYTMNVYMTWLAYIWFHRCRWHGLALLYRWLHLYRWGWPRLFCWRFCSLCQSVVDLQLYLKCFVAGLSVFRKVASSGVLLNEVTSG